MKCPKCGSEDIIFLRNQYGYLNEYECNICSYHLTEKECTEFDYQQRLDKVLAKFGDAGNGELLHPCGAFTIRYNNEYHPNEFMLYDVESIDNNDNFILRLDTVEHLIKDMEAE